MENENSNEQTAWNLSSYRIKMIATLMEKANMFSLGLHYIPTEKKPELGISDHYSAYKCWQQIAYHIDNLLNKDQKKHLKKIENHLEKNKFVLNPDFKKYSNASKSIVSDRNVGLLSVNHIKYINFLIRRVGLDIPKVDKTEGRL